MPFQFAKLIIRPDFFAVQINYLSINYATSLFCDFFDVF